MSVKSIFRIIIVAIFLFSSLCNENGNPTQQTGTKKSYGVFRIFIDQVINRSSFLGKLYDGSIPVISWDTVMTSGECKLLKPKERTCEGCGSGSVCVDNNNCQPEPDTITAGTVTITGMATKGGAATISINPINGNYQTVGDKSPTATPCSEGGSITITASGNESVSGFTLSAKAISPIEISSDSIEMNPGQPILLKWKAAANPANSKISVIIDISYHGGTKAKIECVCRDDGELEIPGAMLDNLKTFGMSGHPKLEMYRESKGTDPSTCAEIQIQSFVQLWLKIPGLISCSDDRQCPEGQECAGDQRCREVQ